MGSTLFKVDLTSVEVFKTIPGRIINHPESVMMFSVQVKCELTCIIITNSTGVDMDIEVKSSIMGSGISDTDRVTVSPQLVSVGENMFEITVTFRHPLETDTGAYSCSAYVRPS